MTTISAIQFLGGAVISCDSRVTSENEISEMPSDLSKVVENGKFLIGVAGKYKAIPLMAYLFSPTQPPASARGIALDKFMTKVFLPELEDFISKKFPPKTTTTGEENGDDDFEFLVVVNGIVFHVSAEFTWTRELGGLYSIGSGSDYALGSLLETTSRSSDVASAEKRTRRSIVIASQRDTNTGGEIKSFSQISNSKK